MQHKHDIADDTKDSEKLVDIIGEELIEIWDKYSKVVLDASFNHLHYFVSDHQPE